MIGQLTLSLDTILIQLACKIRYHLPNRQVAGMFGM